jgi:hypothetical protein
MANEKDSFDFGAFDWATLDETLSFLNNYDSKPLPDPSREGIAGFGEAMMDWAVVENHARASLGKNADLSDGMTNALTDSSISGSHLPGPGWDFENQPCQPQQIMGAETPPGFGESR